jgi:vancomycin permeability regulator SanA
MRSTPRILILPALRGAALFLAAFAAIGLVGELRGRTMDTSLWWVDLHDIPAIVRLPLLAGFATLLAAWAVRPAPGRRRRPLTAAACALFAVLALRDVAGFYAAVGAGGVRPFVPVPLSLLIALLLATLAAAALRAPGAGPTGRRDALAVVTVAAAWAVLFPLAQMLFFGTTDYRRPADAAVVFGARVYASGQPSPLLADRIRTGVELWRTGLVPVLVMSGGDGSDGFNEARVMRDVAVAAGVDPAAILIDPAGVSTEATVANVSALLAAREGVAGPARGLIGVSQAYHLPRVQLAFGAAGIDVLTVPAADPEPIGEMPLLVAREVLAFWAYDLRVCLG